MKTSQFISSLKTGIIALSCVALLTACNDEKEEVLEAAPTMGDPKTSSPNGSRCYEISLFIEDGDNETSDYSNIRFEFFNSGTIIARSPSQEWTGSWNLGFDDGVQKLFLNFQGTTPLLNELTDDWRVVSLNPNNPQFIEDGGINPDVLQVVPSDCAPSTPPSPALQAFNANLVDGPWTIANFIDDGDNETNTFNNATFTFNADGTVVAARAGQQRTGQWSTSQDGNGSIDLDIQFSAPPAPLTGLNEDWDVVSFNNNELVLEDIDGTPADDSFLTFTRN